jgi:hypothetical protein
MFFPLPILLQLHMFKLHASNIEGECRGRVVWDVAAEEEVMHGGQ